MYEYKAQMERVVDGDTVRFLIDHGMYLRSSQSIRLFEVMAPELSEPGGKDARQFVIDWFAKHGDHEPDGPWLYQLITQKDKQTFNRYVGEVVCRQCGACLNDDVIEYLVQE
jgi:micrococcal nuclease